jgi:hypothetical protein
MRSDKGKYTRKHPAETNIDAEITEAVKNKVIKGKLCCADAATVAVTCSKSMAEVGIVLDMLEIPIIKCQLGLFGYQPIDKILTPAQSIDSKIEQAVRNQLVNKRLPCEAAWEIAEAFALPKINIASTCEALGIKIKPCQLGAF